MGGRLWHFALTPLALASFLSACGGLPPDYKLPDAPDNGPPAALPTGRLRVALALGSGGPRGFAHIGVIKALEAGGIKPDLVVGTSSGAFVGALYAAGLSPAQLEAQAYRLNPLKLFDFTLNKLGRFKGEGLQNLVNQAVGARPIEQLDIPFAAVASKVPTGEMVVFNRGNTGVAVRASSAIAGSFIPVVIRGEAYYDGDLVSPVPIVAARRLGGDVIIAVDVSADLADTPPLEKIPTDWISTGIMRKTLVDWEAAQAAVIIRPSLPYYAGGSDEYKRMAIAAGEAAGRAALGAIKAALTAAR